MRNFNDRVEKWFPLINSSLIMNLEDDKGAEDYIKTKSISKIPLHFGSNILPHSKKLLNDVIKQIGGFFEKSNY